MENSLQKIGNLYRIKIIDEEGCWHATYHVVAKTPGLAADLAVKAYHEDNNPRDWEPIAESVKLLSRDVLIAGEVRR